ncbi:MAG: hypothetical protein KA141_10685 [Rubrivivax sp.]|nr:hypothetical protein [Rubrivivax sp.]
MATAKLTVDWVASPRIANRPDQMSQKPMPAQPFSVPTANQPAPVRSTGWAALGVPVASSLKRAWQALPDGTFLHGWEHLATVLVHCNKIVLGGAFRALKAHSPQGN